MPLFARSTATQQARFSAPSLRPRRAQPHSPSDLAMTSPGDRFEREADRVADQVMRAPAAGSPRRLCLRRRMPEVQRGEGSWLAGRRSAAATPSAGALPAAAAGSPVQARRCAHRADRWTRACAPSWSRVSATTSASVRVHTDRSPRSRRRVAGARLHGRQPHRVRRQASTRQARRRDSGCSRTSSRMSCSKAAAARRWPCARWPRRPPRTNWRRRAKDWKWAALAAPPGSTSSNAGGPRLARDLAIEPTVPNAPEPVLTDAQVQAAVRYNAFRFKDPYSIAVVRDLVGVPRFPAVSDEDLARAVARYQADFGLTPDGQAGPGRHGRLTAELRAEDLPEDAQQLRARQLRHLGARGRHAQRLRGSRRRRRAGDLLPVGRQLLDLAAQRLADPGDRQRAGEDELQRRRHRGDADAALLGSVVGRRKRGRARAHGHQRRTHRGHRQRGAGAGRRPLATGRQPRRAPATGA